VLHDLAHFSLVDNLLVVKSCLLVEVRLQLGVLVEELLGLLASKLSPIFDGSVPARVIDEQAPCLGSRVPVLRILIVTLWTCILFDDQLVWALKLAWAFDGQPHSFRVNLSRIFYDRRVERELMQLVIFELLLRLLMLLDALSQDIKCLLVTHADI
jgi:hypothetical protein